MRSCRCATRTRWSRGRGSRRIPVQDQLPVELGRLASLAYVRDLSGPEPRVLRGSIGVGLAAGESAPQPEHGVAANINLASLNIDAWEAVMSSAAGVSLASTVRRTARRIGSGYLPTVMAVRAQELIAGGRTLHHVVVGGARDGLIWRANVMRTNSTATSSTASRRARAPAGCYARLARLTLAPAAASDVEALLDEQPATIPALDIVVDDFELRGKKLGRVEIEAVNRGAGSAPREGGAREWRLNKLNLTMPEASFTATGNWAAAAPGQRVGRLRSAAPATAGAR